MEGVKEGHKIWEKLRRPSAQKESPAKQFEGDPDLRDPSTFSYRFHKVILMQQL